MFVMDLLQKQLYQPVKISLVLEIRFTSTEDSQAQGSMQKKLGQVEMKFYWKRTFMGCVIERIREVFTEMNSSCSCWLKYVALLSLI